MEKSGVPWWTLREAAPRLELWKMIETLGGPEAAEAAGKGAWAAAGLPMTVADRLGAPAPAGRWLVPTDPGWPAVLRGQSFGPVALQVEGNVGLLAEVGVAVVGARACTTAGRNRAKGIAADLVAGGAVVVSGLARGIDAEAHLAAAGRTIAVLGQGLYAPMPAWQRELRARIVTAGGLVLSEFAPEMPGSTYTFPIRNRIIAGLSRGVIVVEAAARSGARNTATHAMRLHLAVWAVPGPPDAICSAGCLDLIEDGVSVFRSSGEVLGRLGVGVPAALVSLLRQPRTLPELTNATGWTTMRMVELLGGLELQGRLARLPGARYGWVDVRSHRSP